MMSKNKGYGRRPLLSLLTLLRLLRLKLLPCYCNECRCCHCRVCRYGRCRYGCGCCGSLLWLVLLSRELLLLLLPWLIINKSIKFNRVQVSFAFHVERWIKPIIGAHIMQDVGGHPVRGGTPYPFLVHISVNFGISNNFLSIYECFWALMQWHVVFGIESNLIFDRHLK